METISGAELTIIPTATADERVIQFMRHGILTLSTKREVKYPSTGHSDSNSLSF
jgi:hypothetical protein